MKLTVITACCFILVTAGIFSCHQQQKGVTPVTTITQGHMPNIAVDKAGNLHLVFGSGDSILYKSSVDGGRTFLATSVVAVLPGLYSFAMRGPQIACGANGAIITACDKSGNIYSFLKSADNNWVKTARVNDADTVAKEGLMALGNDGDITFAAWLDLRGNSRNKIMGAVSRNGGKTWSANILVYASPDSTVCECCKPSVVVKANNVYVMFRNLLHGNRNLYMATGAGNNGHLRFNHAEKIGTGDWQLNGCPMDGGGLTVNAGNQPQTVWRRHDTIFACAPGKMEVAVGEGNSCSIETADNKNILAWNENGDVVCLLPNGTKQHLGKGLHPVLKAVDDNNIICLWENDRQIQMVLIGI